VDAPQLAARIGLSYTSELIRTRGSRLMNQFRSDAVRIADLPRDTPQYLERVARAAVPALADFCLVYLLDGGQLRCVASAHATRAGDRLLRELHKVYKITRDDRESTVAQVVRLRRPSLRAEIRPEYQSSDESVTELARVLDIHRQLAVRSALVVPIEGRSGVLGAVAFSYAQSGRHYRPADLPVAERVVSQVALAVNHGQLLQSQRPQASIGRQARPALTRLRRTLDRLQSTDNRRERTRLLNELTREQRMLTRMLDRYMEACPPPSSRAGRLRVRS
jgi:GAF domain-containing protein